MLGFPVTCMCSIKFMDFIAHLHLCTTKCYGVLQFMWVVNHLNFLKKWFAWTMVDVENILKDTPWLAYHAIWLGRERSIWLCLMFWPFNNSFRWFFVEATCSIHIRFHSNVTLNQLLQMLMIEPLIIMKLL